MCIHYIHNYISAPTLGPPAIVKPSGVFLFAPSSPLHSRMAIVNILGGGEKHAACRGCDSAITNSGAGTQDGKYGCGCGGTGWACRRRWS